MSVTIRRLTTLEQVRRLEPLLGDYIQFVTDDLRRASGVSFDPDVLLTKTLAGLEKVIPPKGYTFVAEEAGHILGMAFVRDSGPDAMEIKRLYVPPAGRGRGIGKSLVGAAIDAARDRGATALRLDTTANLEAAIALYKALGFEERPPYPESDHYEDDVLGPFLLFMEKKL